MRVTTSIFLFALAITAAVWLMRGFGILTFLPGAVIWILLILTIAAGILDVVQRTRRW
ncbi:hypothetical protein ACQ4M4_07695 [Leptolyngbya sp. AN02str]|uniref:hypothetical protein n=1 Tax=Leptolyngbya sp. AN02str TaxID=3423363 RepID=UPI003D322339